MRPGRLFARLVTLSLATTVCLVLAIVATPYLRGFNDEPISGASVMASPRDLQVITQEVRLSNAPDLVLSRGMLYADGNAALGTQISRFVLDGPLFTLNVSGPRAPGDVPASDAAHVADNVAGALAEQLAALGYDTLTVRRGTIQITSREGAGETMSDVEAEFTNKRKSGLSARGSFYYRGHRLKFEASLAPPTDRKAGLRWPAKVALRSAFVDANFDGALDAARDMQLSGVADVSMPSLRRVARWFALPVANAAGLNAASLKGQFTWARNSLSFEQAKLSVDNNDGTGSVTLNLGGDRPLVDGTLAFSSFDLVPYFESLRPQTFGFERPSTSWSSLDLSFPLLRVVDADLRISTPKVAFKGFELGRTAATVSVRGGKLLADVAEIELGSGVSSLQITADTNPSVPRYAIKGKIEGLDGAQAAAAFQFTQSWTGKGSVSLDVTGAGQAPSEVLRSLTGKVALSSAPGLRAPVEAKGLRALAKTSAITGWPGIAKGQTQFDQLDLRFAITNGVAIAETVTARSGSNAFAVSGAINLPETNLDLTIASRGATPPDKALKPSDFLGTDVVRLSGPMAAPTLSIADPDYSAPLSAN